MTWPNFVFFSLDQLSLAGVCVYTVIMEVYRSIAIIRKSNILPGKAEPLSWHGD